MTDFSQTMDRTTRIQAIIREAAYKPSPNHTTRRSPMTFSPSAYLLNNPKFMRKRFGPDSPQLSLDRDYRNRSGILNTSSRKRNPGGNGYCSILRQKKQIADLTTSASGIPSIIIKESQDLLYTEPGSILSAKNPGSSGFTSFILPLNLSKSQSTSLLNSKKHSPVRTPRSQFSVPKTFSSLLAACECDSDFPCVCGKRGLYSPEIQRSVRQIDVISTHCDAISKENSQRKKEMSSEMKYVKDKLQLYAREMKVVLKNRARSKVFHMRRRMHEAAKGMEKWTLQEETEKKTQE